MFDNYSEETLPAIVSVKFKGNSNMIFTEFENNLWTF